MMSRSGSSTESTAAASAASANALAPSASSARAFSGERFHTWTVSPRSSMLRTKFPPSKPVPSQAIKRLSSHRKSDGTTIPRRRGKSCVRAASELGLRRGRVRHYPPKTAHGAVYAVRDVCSELRQQVRLNVRVRVVLGEHDVVGTLQELDIVAEDHRAGPARGAR